MDAHPSQVAAIDIADDVGIAARVMEYCRAFAIGDGLLGHLMRFLAYASDAEDDAGTNAIVKSASVEGDGGIIIIIGRRMMLSLHRSLMSAVLNITTINYGWLIGESG
jgi:hypothetical protein